MRHLSPIINKRPFIFFSVLLILTMLACSQPIVIPEEQVPGFLRPFLRQVTATPLAIVPSERPLSGHWAGDPGVSLDIEGYTVQLEMVVTSGMFTCTMSGTAYLEGMEVYYSDSAGNTITGTFSDTSHVSGTYHVITCGYMDFGPADGTWSASLQGSAPGTGMSGITGAWTGTAYNGDTAFTPMIAILPNCKEGEVCGWFNLPEFSCSGIFELVSVNEGVYTLSAFAKSDTCGTGVDTLTPQSDGSLLYKSSGDFGTDEGTLYAVTDYPIFSDLAGHWTATVHGRGSDGVEYTSTEHYSWSSGCTLGSECAWFHYDEFECKGNIVTDTVWYNVIEGHSVNTSGCSEGSGTDYYQWQSDGSLLHFSQGDWGVGLGILYRD